MHHSVRRLIIGGTALAAATLGTVALTASPASAAFDANPGVNLVEVSGANSGVTMTGHGATVSDFDHDGLDDTLPRAGGVTVLFGSRTGLVTTGATTITQNISGVPGTSEKGDRFGTALAIGKVNGDKYADLAISY